MPKSHHFFKRMNKNSMESKNNVLSVSSYRVTKILFRRQKRYRDLKSTKFVIATRFIDIAGEPTICLNKTSIIKHPISTTFPGVLLSQSYQKLGMHSTHTYYLLYFQLIPVKSSLHSRMCRRMSAVSGIQHDLAPSRCGVVFLSADTCRSVCVIYMLCHKS